MSSALPMWCTSPALAARSATTSSLPLSLTLHALLACCPPQVVTDPGGGAAAAAADAALVAAGAVPPLAGPAGMAGQDMQLLVGAV